LEGGRGIFVMTNGDRGSALAQEIILAVTREYGWPGAGYQEVTLAEVAPEILERIAGSYRIEGEDLTLSVTVVEDHLRLESPDAGVVEAYHPTAEDFFIDLTDGTRIRVERNEDGEVVALQVLGGSRALKIGG
jgi:hypothetical protein